MYWREAKANFFFKATITPGIE
uniref:Uncharacterized protein n=1 Tax=Anguilla anguilla TaxID=7936 RepID=A0A0E9UV56_ANGAN